MSSIPAVVALCLGGPVVPEHFTGELGLWLGVPTVCRPPALNGRAPGLAPADLDTKEAMSRPPLYGDACALLALAVPVLAGAAPADGWAVACAAEGAGDR